MEEAFAAAVDSRGISPQSIELGGSEVMPEPRRFPLWTPGPR